MAYDRELVRGSLDLMILSVLAEGPLYGYALQQKLREASGHRIRLDGGTLYPLLHRLQAAGAIKSRWDDSTGRDRKWYQLTVKGRRRLKQQAVQWSDYVACLHRLLGPVLAEEALLTTPAREDG